MLLTILSYLSRSDYNEDCDDDNSSESSSTSIVRDTMPSAEEDGWEQVSIPISEEEDFEFVMPTSDIPGTDNALTSATSSNGSSSIFQGVKEWRHQRALQRNQLGQSISNTFAELSKEDPKQMEEEAIQRAMELSMLDVALVHSHHATGKNSKHETRQWSPHKILGVPENASPMEIKDAYRRLARLHVSRQFNGSLLNFLCRNEFVLIFGDHFSAILTLPFQISSASFYELAPRQRR